ncbi:hypothetical protein DM47_2683 [Burkholderia mallei]|nr:hypothetical protein DM47_2683 [Burkholderia mallei]
MQAAVAATRYARCPDAANAARERAAQPRRRSKRRGRRRCNGECAVAARLLGRAGERMAGRGARHTKPQEARAARQGAHGRASFWARF